MALSHARTLAAALLVAGMLLAAALAGRSEPAAVGQEPTELAADARREVTLGAARCAAFRLPPNGGDYAQVEVEQRGVDTVIEVAPPGSGRLRTVDRPIGAWGKERTSLAVTDAGARFSVCALRSGSGGRFLVTVDGPREARDTDRARWEGENHFWQAREHESSRDESTRRRSVDGYRAALERFLEADDGNWQAVTLARLGIALRRQGELDRAATVLERALPLLEATDERRQAAEVLNEQGLIDRRRGRIAQALGHYERALEAARELGDPARSAKIEGNIARAHLHQGAFALAIDSLRQQLADWQSAGERTNDEIESLIDLAEVYDLAGDSSAALETIDQALTTIATDGAFDNEAHAWVLRGRILLSLNRDEEALEELKKAVDLAVRAGAWHVQAAALNTIGRAWIERGRAKDAEEAFRRALSIYRAHDERRSAAIVHMHIAWALDEQGRTEYARDAFRAASKAFGALGDTLGTASTSYGMGRLLLRSGALDEAYEWIHEARLAIETHRLRVRDRELGNAFLALKHRYFALEVDALMRIAERDPTGKAAKRAFALAERARARDLWERLRGSAEASGTPAVDKPFDISTTQRQLLDPTSQFVMFSLGELRSYVWRVDRDRIVSARLPPRAEIERRVRSAHKLLRSLPAPHLAPERRATLADLAAMLLGPIRDGLTASRLVVIPDGALHYLPFSALPDPATPGEPTPLIARFEIVRIPSLAVLAELQHRSRHRPRPEGLLAVVADPVVDPDDPRLLRSGVSADQGGKDTAGGLPTRRFVRLPFAGQEARDILELVPAAKRFEALGFAANVDTVMSADLGRFRVVHFATHGIVDERRPERSGLALSAWTVDGQRRPSMLTLSDVYRLRLPVDLVVLSACQTALGREVEGEGMVGLTRGFLHAGAQSVVVSLWPVDDRTTARLMVYFYRALLEGEPAPAAALRQAQQKLRAEPGREAPFYWAGFVLVGNWL